MFLNSAQHPYKISLRHMLFTWQRSAALFFIGGATLVATLYEYSPYLKELDIPSFPLSVIGGALGIFVSFRTNSAYQRWWEGRKLWGRMINTSRHICAQAIAYHKPGVAREVVHRHIAYVHALRCGLRDEAPHEDQHYQRATTEETRTPLIGSTNVNHALLIQQMKRFVQSNREGTITDFHLSDLEESVRHLLDIQGGLERIKKTPFPPAYGFLGTTLTRIFSILLPLGLVKVVGFWVIPLNLLICMTFQMINEVGRVLENPFLNIWPALALSSMSLTIERNLREALQEELPPAEAPFKVGSGHVLM